MLLLLWMTAWTLIVAVAQNPGTLYIPLRVDGNDKYTVQVNMTNNGVQTFHLAITTATGYTVVAEQGCVNCSDSTLYQPAQNPVAETPKNVSIPGWSAAGSLLKENCTLHQRNGSEWKYPLQSVMVANNSVAIPSGASGLFGLGTNGRDGNWDDTLGAGFLRRNPARKNFTYGMAIKRRRGRSISQAEDDVPTNDGDDTDGGELHWLIPDSTAYRGEVSWKPMAPFDTTPNPDSAGSPANSDWFVDMDAWLVASGNTPPIGRTTGRMTTFLDPFFSGIIFPQNDTRGLYAIIPGAESYESASPGPVTVWTVPCNTKMNLTITFGSLTTTVTESTLLRRASNDNTASDRCFSAIEEWVDPKQKNYLLGSIFLSEIYMIIMMTNSKEAQLGLAERERATAALIEETKKVKTALIAGISVACAVLVLVLVFGIVFFIRHRRRKRRREAEGQRLRPEPFMSQSRHTPANSMSTGLLASSPPPPGSPGSPDWLGGSPTHSEMTHTNYAGVGVYGPPITPQSSSDPRTFTPPGAAAPHRFFSATPLDSLSTLTHSGSQSRGHGQGAVDTAPPPYRDGTGTGTAVYRDVMPNVAIADPPKRKKRKE